MDLDDTVRCPVGDQCASCGSDQDLDVATFDTVVGVGCVTLCAECALHARLPRLGWGQAAEMAVAHCGHLGIDLECMAALRADDSIADRGA